MTVFDHLKQVTGVPTYANAEHNKDLIDAYLLRQGREQGLRLPSKGEPERYNYFGGWVATPVAGLHSNVVYVDLSSLYPSFLLALNAGPNTIIGTQDELHASDYDEDDCVWGYIDTRPVKHVRKGEDWRVHAHDQFKMIYAPDVPAVRWADDPQHERCYFLKPDIERGFVADAVGDLIDMKYEYSGDLYDAIKRVTNSSYGVLAYANKNSSFRLYDWRIAEAVTLSGRKLIQWTEQRVRQYLEDEFGIPMDETFVKMADTDGAGICWPDAPGRDGYIEMGEEACEHVNTVSYADYMAEEFGVEGKHHMEVEVESYASSVFVPARDYERLEDGVKKTYAQRIGWDEGEFCDEVSITGFEAVRSDTSPLTTKLQTWVLDQLTRHGTDAREDIFAVCKVVEQAVRDGAVPVEAVAKRGGIGQPLDEYGTSSRRPSPLYRGAKYADEYLGVDLSEGSKPFVVYLETPDGLPRSTYLSETAENGDVIDAISVEHARDLPENLDVAWTKHADKAITEPLRPILRTMGYSWAGIRDDSVQRGLEAFTS